MIQDMTHLRVLHDLAEELQVNLIHYNQLCNGKADKAELLALRLMQNDELVEILRKQRRHLRYMNGEHIEPETHVVEAVLTGFGGMQS
jgi:hypothetical protein